MKSVTFYLDPKFKSSLPRIFSEVSKVNVDIELDLANNAIVVRDIEDDEFETAQKFVEKIGKVQSVSFNNVTPTATTLSKQSKEGGLVINLVKPETLKLQEAANSLMRTIHWAVTDKNVPERVILNYIRSCNGTLNMAYAESPLLPIERGNLVEVCMGQNIPGELNGGNVPCIVCWMQKEYFAHVVPLVSKIPNSSNASHTITAKPQEDLSYSVGNQDTAYTVLLDKGQLIHRARIQKIIGTVSKDFVNKVFNGIITCTVENLGKKIKPKSERTASDPPEKVTTSQEPPKPTTGSCEKMPTSSGNLDVTPSTPPPHITFPAKSPNKPLHKHEQVLTSALADSLNSVNKSNPKKEEIAKFMERINMPKDKYELFFQAFVQTASVNKLVKADICERISVVSSTDMDKDVVAQTLKTQFQQWLKENHPQILAECPRISFVDLLKLVKPMF